MAIEKRKSDIPLPENLPEMLNEAQRQALPGLRYSGWEPRFVRKIMFQDPVFVVHNVKEGRIGILDGSGSVKTQSNIKVRDQEIQTQPPPTRDCFARTK